ncbi:PKD domain-containing protein [candidate division WOR-3 bacterium]|uniref:PKD domain-containing protein n=1 Tax=candidate division WOR-3 bacterium TaxID=2052148 RepID=A0A9D5QD21_UNCW3|nr:PKD domain-containing protein [candidate division WOR-3 bacterium]MBD3365278.1 PKD domain-containing protein [candidate division WOR-3 bacterium]
MAAGFWSGKFFLPKKISPCVGGWFNSTKPWRTDMIKRYGVATLIAISILPLAGCDILNTNSPPDTPVIAASATDVLPETEVTLNVTCTDPDEDELTFSWQATGGAFDQTTGEQVIWTAPGVNGTYTISVEAQDPSGETSSASINIVVSDTGGGGDGVYVVVGETGNEDLWIPFTNGEYGLTQCIYYAADIGRSGTITELATMASTAISKQYNNFKIWMLEVSAVEVVDTLEDNYGGGTPELVYSSSSVTYGDAQNEWTPFELDTPFDYDGSSNLLVQFEFEGYVGNVAAVGSYAFVLEMEEVNRHVTVNVKGRENGLPNLGATSLRLTFSE